MDDSGIRVGVIGAAGRMGSTVCDAVEAQADLALVARVEHGDDLAKLIDAGVDVAVDFTVPDAVKDNVRFCLDNGIHVVIGTTGLSDEDLGEIGSWTGTANAFYAPNFALGAVLMMKFAALAARYYDHAEIIERHHERKLDAPSGTAKRTAALMGDADPAGDGSGGTAHGNVTIHSVRLPGLVAHQEVIFGAPGETLTIKHDSIDRVSFMPGVILAIEKVAEHPGLTVGLENLLDL
ncbi:MAG TPA: 4-hydroxy-tetrahydrodipicolinate reductase [Actinomycetota bacterium]|nr:4-hydroxy-tetrahydrodipicolinate reductase [Actinomycetota bacterium]